MKVRAPYGDAVAVEGFVVGEAAAQYSVLRCVSCPSGRAAAQQHGAAEHEDRCSGVAPHGQREVKKSGVVMLKLGVK